MGGILNSINLGVYHYGSLNPLKYVDPTGLSDELPDQAITPEQSKLAQAGEFKKFWESRWDNNKDPVSRTALIGWGDKETQNKVGASGIEKAAAAFTWARLDNYIKSEGIDVTMDQLGKELAVAHAGSVSLDKQGIPNLLNPQQVADYHHQVFAEHGIPSYIFGGTQGVAVPSALLPLPVQFFVPAQIPIQLPNRWGQTRLILYLRISI